MEALNLYKIVFHTTNYFGEKIKHTQYVVAKNEDYVKSSGIHFTSCKLIQEAIQIID